VVVVGSVKECAAGLSGSMAVDPKTKVKGSLDWPP